MITHRFISGYPAVYLENDSLRISILPTKGADVYELIHKETTVDFLYKTQSGLRMLPGYPVLDVIESYEGGWQELFPNCGDACRYRGVTLPVHGEVAVMPWDMTIIRDDNEEISVLLSVRTRLIPFRLERIMRLVKGRSCLEIDETVKNLSDDTQYYVWGHHIMLGGDFLEEGCVYRTSARTISVPEHPKEGARARLCPGQRQPWPLARSRHSGGTIDLSVIPGPDIRSHDEVYLEDFVDGAVSVTNPRLGLTFSLRWDAQVFGSIAMWQPYGGIDIPPWTGSYGVGIEPWTTSSNLAGAIESGRALSLGAGEEQKTSVFVDISYEQ